MPTEFEINFARNVVDNPPAQEVEEIASESHETRRVPDPYIFIVNNGKFVTPNGEFVENSIDTSSHLGKVERQAFDKIQNWAKKTDEGYAVWFSPPFASIYPTSKIIIQELYKPDDHTKVVINRAIVLDKDSDQLLEIANQLSVSEIPDEQYLRSNPLFPEQQKFNVWFTNLSTYTNQADSAKKGVDIAMKTDIYAKLSDIYQTVAIYGENKIYDQVFQGAREKGLIGDAPGSCPYKLRTAFQTVFDNSTIITTQEAKYVKNCGNCGAKIESRISKGYRCKSCGGAYEGC